MADHRKRKVEEQQLIKLLQLGFTRQQICDFFCITPKGLQSYIKDTFEGRTFNDLKAEYSVQMQATVMANLVNLSKHNAHVAIFLAKSICGLNENYSAPVNEDAENAFAGALKKASRSISQAKDLVSIPDNDGSGEDIL